MVKVYRSKVTIDILHEDPEPDNFDLENISYQISQGDWSGNISVEHDHRPLTRDELQAACDEHGTDINFLLENRKYYERSKDFYCG